MMIEIGDLVFPAHYGSEALGVVCDIYEHLDGQKKPHAKVLMKNGQAYSFDLKDLEVHTKKNNKQRIKRR
jgi:hypothetical protein|tara:strand:- start:298 stop:507 length:210 start_codon:yes stop_codon:yes gene_type:complete